MTSNRHNGIFEGVDFVTVLLYVLIVAAGWLSITSASYDEGAADFFSFSHFYMKQLVWIGAAWIVAVVVLLLDARVLSHVRLSGLFRRTGDARRRAALRPRGERREGVVRVRLVPRAARRVRQDRHGARAGPRDERRLASRSAGPGDLFKVGVVDLRRRCSSSSCRTTPVRASSLGSFLFVLYREGLNKWLCIPVLLIAALFIVSFLLSPMTLLVSLILVCTLSEAMMTGQWRSRLIYLASLALASILLCMTMAARRARRDGPATPALLTVTLLSLVGGGSSTPSGRT